MALINISWHQAISFFLFSLFAFPIDALPRKKAASSSSSTTSTAGTSAVAAAGGVTTATDGSMILDKTVTIK